LTAAYARYEFHVVAQKFVGFCSEELGGFYLDILKDRLYTTLADSRPRRAAQSALWHITNSLLRLMAPILSFTADEAWQTFTRKTEQSVFEELWYQFPEIGNSEALRKDWGDLRQLRETVNKHLEEQRIAGKIGSSLAAELDIYAHGPVHDSLSRLKNDLRFVFITSSAAVHVAEGPVRVEVKPSANTKCERCWHYRSDVGADASHADICGRCVANLYGSGEPRVYA
jgi:isoleucyl-tRNA synthetase